MVIKQSIRQLIGCKAVLFYKLEKGVKGWDSNVEVKCSMFKSCFKLPCIKQYVL